MACDGDSAIAAAAVIFIRRRRSASIATGLTDGVSTDNGVTVYRCCRGTAAGGPGRAGRAGGAVGCTGEPCRLSRGVTDRRRLGVGPVRTVR